MIAKWTGAQCNGAQVVRVARRQARTPRAMATLQVRGKTKHSAPGEDTSNLVAGVGSPRCTAPYQLSPGLQARTHLIHQEQRERDTKLETRQVATCGAKS